MLTGKGGSVLFGGWCSTVRPRDKIPRYGVVRKPELGLGSFKIQSGCILKPTTLRIIKKKLGSGNNVKDLGTERTRIGNSEHGIEDHYVSLGMSMPC